MLFWDGDTEHAPQVAELVSIPSVILLGYKIRCTLFAGVAGKA